MALSAGLLSDVDRWLGSGQAVQSDADKIDFVLEVSPIKLASAPSGTPNPPLYFSVGGYRNVTGAKRSPARLLTPSLSIQLLNESFGTLRDDGRTELQQFVPGDLQVGAWELIVPDGDSSDLDRIAYAYGWGDAECKLKVGRKGDAYTAFETFLAFKVVTEPEFNQDRITFQSKPALVNWNAFVQTAIYAGTGTWEGDADLAGLTKPKLLGVRRFFPAQLLVWADLRYAISDGADGGLQSIVTVYEGGHEGAQFTASLANGGFTLTAQPSAGPIHVHAQGDKFDAGAYSAAQGKVIRKVFQMAASGVTFNAADITAHANTVGIHMRAGQSPTVRQATELLVRPLQVVYPNEAGTEWHLKTVAAPPGSPVVTFEEKDLAVDGLTVAPASPPVWRVRVGYRGLDEIPSTVLSESAAVKAFLSSEFRWKTATDATVKNEYPNALDLVIPTQMEDPTQAQTAATNALALFKVPRNRYTLRLTAKWFRAYLMDEFQLKVPRYGLDSGKNLLCTGLDVTLGRSAEGDAVAAYTLTGWG